jgi:hypothetical protein
LAKEYLLERTTMSRRLSLGKAESKKDLGVAD